MFARRLLPLIAAWGYAAGYVAGCAAPPPPPAAPPPAAPEVDRGPLAMESEIGGMNEEALERAFAALEQPVLACVATRAERVKELGGRFLVSLRIDREGRPRWAYLSESTLGDRSAERCIVDLVRETTWPKPVGGEGLASRVFEIDPTRSPIEWEPKRVRTVMKIAAKSLAKCRKSARGRFVATAYVRPDGRVAAASVTPPDVDHEPEADCLWGVIEKLRFGSPGRRFAKVTFDVP